jgi:hypothetical protein
MSNETPRAPQQRERRGTIRPRYLSLGIFLVLAVAMVGLTLHTVQGVALEPAQCVALAVVVVLLAAVSSWIISAA